MGNEMTITTAAPKLLAHQVPLTLDSGDTSFVLICTALVLFMTLPGLALFYAGMVRKKNLLATLAQVTGVAVVAALVWVVIGYSLAFGVGPTDHWQALLGSTDLFMLQGIEMDTAYKSTPKLPEYLWVVYQMTFAMITPALIVGAVAERMKFSALLLFSALWSLLVYAPVCHWVWGGGFLGAQGVLDFAGGAVVHINSGVAGLVAALILGPRRGFGRDMMAPHNLSLTLMGGAMLLVGWIGFNAGSEWAADSIAAVATLNTILAAMTGAVGWVVFEWFERKKPTLLGMVSGLVAGLVAITPAAGFVNPAMSLLIGLAGGGACYLAATKLKNWLKYDDSLDAFGVHGVGGIVGALLTGLFASEAINALGVGADIGKQALGIVVVMAWSGGVTAAICFLVKAITGLRVSEEAEIEGLDTAQHGEQLHP
jgi:Amt family ammonium transporter